MPISQGQFALLNNAKMEAMEPSETNFFQKSEAARYLAKKEYNKNFDWSAPRHKLLNNPIFTGAGRRTIAYFPGTLGEEVCQRFFTRPLPADRPHIIKSKPLLPNKLEHYHIQAALKLARDQDHLQMHGGSNPLSPEQDRFLRDIKREVRLSRDDFMAAGVEASSERGFARSHKIVYVEPTTTTTNKNNNKNNPAATTAAVVAPHRRRRRLLDNYRFLIKSTVQYEIYQQSSSSNPRGLTSLSPCPHISFQAEVQETGYERQHKSLTSPRRLIYPKLILIWRMFNPHLLPSASQASSPEFRAEHYFCRWNPLRGCPTCFPQETPDPRETRVEFSCERCGVDFRFFVAEGGRVVVMEAFKDYGYGVQKFGGGGKEEKKKKKKGEEKMGRMRLWERFEEEEEPAARRRPQLVRRPRLVVEEREEEQRREEEEEEEEEEMPPPPYTELPGRFGWRGGGWEREEGEDLIEFD